ncbi:LamG-like jellyroll fold domain-containing protein [Maribellus maritimus]|uniref:LamG-like jellyroll fold domain-containing protein n=1 Tax=Maribellus maritimus TaxID=2870838 RepID=UPI001EE9BB2B|nr:LamG-like jellyroll fold domain-containing protein [Maribellus maritimus]MCG6186305.1 T9SS type A sorting domain-containing protein [Maribellus maritimus]
MKSKNIVIKGIFALCLMFTSLWIHAQEMGINFNESLFHAEDVDKLGRTKTTWVRGFFEFFKYYENQSSLTDVDDQLEDFLNLKNAGYKTILNIKWNFHNQSYPDTTSAEIVAYNEFLQRVLDRVWGKIDIIVVGNEPFIESMNDLERNTRLAPFYQFMCNRVHEYKNGKADIPIYFGAFNRLYDFYRDTDGVLQMLNFVKETPWIEGIDLHIHHKNNNDIVSMYSYADARIRDDQKILMTEFSLVFWWQDHTRDLIPSEFASKYNYSADMLVHQYIFHALNERRPKEEWDDFLSGCPWFENRKHYLWEVYELLTQYESFNIATYSYQISWGPNFDGNTMPWLLNNLIAATTIEDDPETGENQFNYAFIDDFHKIQEVETGENNPTLPPDPTKIFMEFNFDENLTDASPENVIFNLTKGTETYTDGKFGKALNFNNTAYVTLQDALINAGAENSTLGVWVKMDQSTDVANAGMTILHQKDPAGGTPPGRIMMEILNGDMPASFESGIRAQSFEVINPETWYHIAIVHDAEKRMKSIYVNGELKGIADFGTEQSLGPFVLGAFKTEERAFLYGSIDELFWTREVLSPNQIKSIMSKGITQSFDDLLTAVTTVAQPSDFNLFFPNPVSNSIRFSSKVVEEQGQFRLFDLNGRAMTALQPVHSGQINLGNLTKGMYLLKVFTEKEAWSECLILAN